ncbi:hypothetical protein [Magnetofaba australis]|uniref:Secreted protein with PEP-CTERM sorting signal n=1 Tax=Magnetofaba australis IT-1 TaxID=1434232 RepID=A0A1Y2K971_9PROT|nr:hypothetical protein [Magnetofaba australis]OSM07295.1 hypothetical protein MAIT1_04485 [Magnetofaba australis IT-1]
MKRSALVAAALALAPASALAHTGHHEGFNLLHFLTDHPPAAILAMVVVAGVVFLALRKPAKSEQKAKDHVS